MPRAEGAIANQNAPQKRTFPRPWSYKPCETGYIIHDARGVEMMRVGFTASEMREQYPDGKTLEEALGIARWVVKTVNVENKDAKDGAVLNQGRVQRGGSIQR
ncbi:MAG: hypothetical protein EOO77_17450 [Oxalobacteraceae bacterium]|nr:MAG: hypothetical protein EOO77_17450 [Oxalobacteraceae bacterium]